MIPLNDRYLYSTHICIQATHFYTRMNGLNDRFQNTMMCRWHTNKIHTHAQIDICLRLAFKVHSQSRTHTEAYDREALVKKENIIIIN